ncbi:ABC transporter permease [Dysgonomonas sp. 216]|uniref:ABC transporter permease n=1 Tax=Dysgonomonas sp. 216 TaxID=2302934 RepID=UPI0013D52C3D|nr:FtsX-like permease family protein [Dysgonomonas sp. 216]NDW18560.1 ABC transporter permease [Dysgonomonas sp. 216]
MNFELFIAKRIHFSGGEKKKVSSPAIKIATAGIALGLAAMILSVCIVIGFKQEIRNKVVGFSSHIQITNYDGNTSYETHPICVNDTILRFLKEMDEIKHVELYATKPGIIKTDTDFQGIVMKGVDRDYDWSFFQQHMLEGNVLNVSDSTSNNKIIISKYIADKLNLKLGDSFLVYFIQDPPKARKMIINGIYSTDFSDYDKIFIIGNLSVIRRLNGWEKDQVSGIELYVKDFDKLDDIAMDMYFDMASYRDREGNAFMTRSVKNIVPAIFSWLNVIDMNVWIIIILMLAVSGFTMISGLLILILERTNMIGILKAMGAKNVSIRKVFLYVSSFLILKGMFWGNLIALSICFIQKYCGILKLDPATYYISEVPIHLNVWYILLLNLGAFLVSLLMMVGPSYLIARISPAKSIRFE